MKITIKTERRNFSMPVPWVMAGFAIRNIPDSMFEEMREKVSAPYDQLVCRENLLFLYEECKDALMEYGGLELIRVEGADGTFISVVV